jgi:hypothetical protein
MKQKTTEKFIEDAKKIHGDKYDYSLVEYLNAFTKVKIICYEHGIFEQIPNSHISAKCGCMKCGGRYSNQNLFILKSREIHNNKYDYSLVEYKNAHEKIKIICPEHGLFEQLPMVHIMGCGCYTCGRTSIITKQTISQENFIKKCKNVHNKKYDYSLVEYTNCKSKVKIICPEHGTFEQSPDHHSRGIGCPECSKYYGGKIKNKDLYIFYDKKFNLMKIGVSNDPNKRIKEISKGKDKTGLILLKTYKKLGALESLLHKEYDKFRINHTLYTEGSTEWFNLDESEIYNIDIFIKYHK